MGRRFACLMAGVAELAACPPAMAQLRPEETFQRTYFFEQQIRERLEADIPAKQPALVEWGGFYIPSYTFYNDIANDHAHVTIQDLRLWTQIRLDEVHRIYARMRLAYTDYAAGDSQGFRGHDLEGPNLDQGFYELDVTGAVAKYWGERWPFELTARGGRQYLEVGRGIALGETLDAGWFELKTRDFNFAGFAGRGIESTDNMDQSVPGFSRSRRTFYGCQIDYAGLGDHEPYVFFVLQRDWSEEKPENLAQDYRYKSHYYGVGCRGSVTSRTKYEVEGIWEFGKGAANGQIRDKRERIEAFAFDAEVDHYMEHALKPVLSAEYAFASGDDDRVVATTAFRGNQRGTHDTAFQGFGYVNSGLALGARFTNLQFVRLGGRFTPYDKKTAAGRIDLGMNYYFLWKADREAPISDFRALDTSSDVGQEVDVFCEWRVFSDLGLSLHYGRFYPGQAYLDRQPRDFFYAALNISF